jgi:hypothetical protein
MIKMNHLLEREDELDFKLEELKIIGAPLT